MDQFAFVPHKTSTSNNYITVAEETILEACDKGTKAALFPDSDTVSPGALIEKVFGSNRFGGRKYATITKQQQQPIVKAQRFILGKSVTTNGFDLAVLVIDTSTKKKPPLKGSSECYLSQAAKVQRKKKFSSDSIPDSFYQNPFQVRVTGVDVGQTYAVGICSNLGNPVTGLLSKTNLTIKTKALSQPCRNFTHYLEKKKTDEIYRLERELERKPGENTKEYFSRRSQILPKLSSFYNSKAIMKAKNNKDKAQRGEWDYATNQILKMHGYTMFDRHDPARNPVLFVFGDCHVGDGTYSAFETYLVSKLRSLGFPIIFENEYYTSQKCPECHRQTELAGVGVRIKYCESCDLHMHRDIMAGDNLSRIGLCLLLKRNRPGYLSKEKPDGKILIPFNSLYVTNSY
jgi:hypothetical protein